ncbi:MAG: sigma-54 dependent transcriptional regulator [Thermodesulfobacteriota bacterium]
MTPEFVPEPKRTTRHIGRSPFYPSPYLLVPVIFGGLAALAAIVGFRLTVYCQQNGLDQTWPLTGWSLIIAGLACLCGYLVVRLLLKPAQGFLEKAKTIPVLSGGQVQAKETSRLDKLEYYQQVFEQVASVLNKVDVRQLFPNIIGESQAMRGLFGQIIKIAPTEATVLIVGESGTGKELAATSIHELSPRKYKPLVKVNCAAIPEGLLESELFGHEKGAFTGATSGKPGRFELADEGTLFLDEIGDMPPTTQAKILRALQEKEFERVGGTRSLKIDVRLIAATNKNLEDMVRAGTFREDLYYRLHVLTLFIPPLRDRSEDIPLLVNHFLKQSPRPIKLSSQALQTLMAYSWPGNVRELKNTLDRAMVMSENGLITDIPVPPGVMAATKREILVDTAAISDSKTVSLDDRMRDLEKAMIIKALEANGGVQVKAAEALGINQRSLWHRIKKYGIDVQAIKATRTDVSSTIIVENPHRRAGDWRSSEGSNDN